MAQWLADHGAALILFLTLVILLLVGMTFLAVQSFARRLDRLEGQTSGSMDQFQAAMEARRIESDPVRLAVVALLALRADRQMTHDDLQNLVQDLQEDTREIDALINEVRRLLGRTDAS